MLAGGGPSSVQVGPVRLVLRAVPAGRMMARDGLREADVPRDILAITLCSVVGAALCTVLAAVPALADATAPAATQATPASGTPAP
ncbi:hypothetical protein, partial [Acidisphaera rubrifaciens]|uniref:hypothetical protein n=1 Tax=Acidisphaera rubrifaciens TaxID=50715 RepID=UPI0019D6E98A